VSGSVSGLSSRKLYWEARNELIAANAVTIFIVESLLKAGHDCIERVQIARPIIFSSTRTSVMIRLSFAKLKKYCLSSEQDHVFRQFTAGNDML